MKPRASSKDRVLVVADLLARGFGAEDIEVSHGIPAEAVRHHVWCMRRAGTLQGVLRHGRKALSRAEVAR